MKRSVVFLALMLCIIGCSGTKTKSMDAYRKGVALQREGKSVEALEQLKKSIEIYSKNIHAHMKYQDVLIAQGKKEEVLKEYKAKLDENPRDPTWYYLYGKLLGWDKGKDLFKKSISLNSKFAWGYYALGCSLLVEGKFSDAATEFEKANELDSDIPEAHLQLGRTYAMLKRLGDSEKEFRRVVEIDPGNADGYLYLGNVCLITGNISEAALNYEKALQLDPSSLSAQSAMGRIYLIRGKPEEALKVFEKVSRARPTDPWSFINLARAQYLKEKPKEAIKSFKQALKLNPGLVEVHYLLALAYMDTKSWQDARSELSKVEKIKKNYPGLHKARALIYLANGSDSQAESELAAEEKRGSKDPDIYYIRGQILYRNYQVLKGEEQFKMALSIDSRYYPAYLGLGQIDEYYFKEFARAVRIYEEALVLFPNDIEITYRLGRCYSLWGMEKEAAAYFKKAFELGMDDWNRIGADPAIQGLKYMPEVATLLDTYKKKPGAITKTKHSELISSSDLIYYQVNRAYRKM